MKVTYSSSVGNNPYITCTSTRVLTENLLNSDMDVHFSNAILTATMMGMKKYKKAFNIDGKIKLLEGYYARLLKSLFSKYKEDVLFNTIKGDYLIYSMCSSAFDYNVLANVLNNGGSVAAGGTEIIMNGFDYVRNMFRKYGVEEKNLKNLMLISGYINQYTNLRPYIEKWKDVSVHDKLEPVMYAKKDYMRFPEMQQIKNIIDKVEEHAFKLVIWPDTIGVIFDSRCYWGKCKFCTYNHMGNYDFIENLSADEVIDAIMGICEENKVYTVAIQDDYFVFDDKKTKIVEGLRSNGIDLICQTGIHLLKNENYAKKLMDIFYLFSIGLEWTTDEVLKRVNKGYRWKDIQIALDNIKKYYNKNVITSNIIVDLPITSAEDAVLNYKRLGDIKEDMESHNVLWPYTVSLLTIYYQRVFDRLKAAGNIREPQEGKISGRIGMLKELEKHIEIPSFIYNDGIPFERIDDNGNALHGDLHIVDEDIFRRAVDKTVFWERLNEIRSHTDK